MKIRARRGTSPSRTSTTARRRRSPTPTGPRRRPRVRLRQGAHAALRRPRGRRREPAKVTVSDARNAIEAVLAGQPCPSRRPRSSAAPSSGRRRRAGWPKARRSGPGGGRAHPIDAAGLKALTANDSGEAARRQRLGHLVRPLPGGVPRPDRRLSHVPRPWPGAARR
jgi:hypothetical protein